MIFILSVKIFDNSSHSDLDVKISKILSKKFIVLIVILALLNLSLFLGFKKMNTSCYSLKETFNYEKIDFVDEKVPEADLKYLSNFQTDSFPSLHGDFGENSENQSLA
jgi:hypothetical protein